MEAKYLKNRKETESFILSFLGELDPTGYNVEKYTEIFKDMSDQTFYDYMSGIRDKTKTLIVFAPLFKSKGLTTENGIRLAEKYDLPLFEQLRFTNKDGTSYKTAQKYLIMKLPIRRQSQNLVKKISVPDDNKSIDYLTYQPTGASKGSTLSYPEVGALVSRGLNNTVEELFRFRGGDKGGFRQYNNSINRLGDVSLRTISPYLTGVESAKAFKNYLIGMGMVLRN